MKEKLDHVLKNVNESKDKVAELTEKNRRLEEDAGYSTHQCTKLER